MANRRNYVPRNNAEFDRWFKNLNMYVSLKCMGSKPDWDHIIQRELNALDDDVDWYTSYAPTLKPHTSDLTKKRD